MNQKLKSLVGKFKSAGLTLKLLNKPMSGGAGVEKIVQMNIGRSLKGNNRSEWFEIYPGADDNRIEVLNFDFSKSQLTLLVHEPAREFEVEEKKTMTRNVGSHRKRIEYTGNPFRENKHSFFIKHKTPDNVRHFLMGVDERQLFIAQTNDRITTVAEARRSLGNTVQFHEGKRKMTPNRQGEWFFVKATDVQVRMIDNALSKNLTVINKKSNIGQAHGDRANGNPHIAEELVKLPSNITAEVRSGRRTVQQGGFPVRGHSVFIRGKIRHIDHKTVTYKYWHEVIANNEGATGRGNSSGISWID